MNQDLTQDLAPSTSAEWNTPDFEEIPLNCEIASYHSGELES